MPTKSYCHCFCNMSFTAHGDTARHHHTSAFQMHFSLWVLSGRSHDPTWTASFWLHCSLAHLPLAWPLLTWFHLGPSEVWYFRPLILVASVRPDGCTNTGWGAVYQVACSWAINNCFVPCECEGARQGQSSRAGDTQTTKAQLTEGMMWNNRHTLI